LTTDPRKQSAPKPASERGEKVKSKYIEPLAVRGIAEAARLIGLGRRTTWSLVNRGALPHRRVGRALLFDPRELRAWLDAGAPDDPGAEERVREAMRKGATDA
jgi:excisionase family DNA binding protein